MWAGLQALGLPGSSTAPLVPAGNSVTGGNHSAASMGPPFIRFESNAGPNILYAVSTCQKYHSTRAVAVYETWCNYNAQINQNYRCLFYSDHQSTTAPYTHLVAAEGGGGLDDLRRAQLRYLRILKHASDAVLGGSMGNTHWVVVADDDSYIFHYNMFNYLSSLDPSRPIYTGHTLPNEIYPIDGDGEGHHLEVKVYTHFACGGGGSVFSSEALRKISYYMSGCTKDMEGGKWAGWQSDWVFGACADRADVPLLDQDAYADKFGQFLHKNNMPALATDPGPKDYFAYNEGFGREPVSLHPLANPSLMHELREALPNAHVAPVTNVKVQLKEDGHLNVEFR